MFSNAFTFARSFGSCWKPLPRDLAKVNAWKTMFDPIIDKSIYLSMCLYTLFWAIYMH